MCAHHWPRLKIPKGEDSCSHLPCYRSIWHGAASHPGLASCEPIRIPISITKPITSEHTSNADHVPCRTLSNARPADMLLQAHLLVLTRGMLSTVMICLDLRPAAP